MSRKSFKQVCVLLVLGIVCFGWTAVASAEAISLNFVGSSGFAGYAVGSDAAGVVSVGNWNDVPIAQQTNMPLKDSTGATVSGLTFSTSEAFQFSGSAYGPNGASFAQTGNTNMMQAMIYHSGGQAVDLTFNGTVPYNTFDIYVYYNAALANTQRVSILGGSGNSLGLSQLAYESAGSDTAFVLSDGVGGNNANYVKFAGLTSANVPTNFIIQAQGTSSSAFGGPFGGFCGLQIVSVPEPGTLVLLGTALLGLLAYAWRKRKSM